MPKGMNKGTLRLLLVTAAIPRLKENAAADYALAARSKDAVLNLKTRMTLAISLLTATVLSVLAFVAQFYFVEEMKQLVYSQQFSMVSALADQLDDKLIATQTELVTTAGTLTTGIVRDPEKLASFFADRPDTLAMFDNGLLLFSREGRLLAENPREPELVARDYSAEPYLKKTIETRSPQISPPFIPPQAHREPIIMFTAPVFGDNGDLIAILAGSLDLAKNNFLGKIGTVKVGERGYLYLFNNRGTMIVHPDRDRIGKEGSTPGRNMLYDRAMNGFEGAGETVNSRNTSMISSFRKLRSTGWVLACNFPVAEAYRPVHRAQHLLVLALTAVFLCSVAAVWLFTRRLTAPLISFTSQIRRLRNTGDSLSRIRVESDDEIGVLGEAFNLLLEQLELQKKELQRQLDFSQRMIDTMPIPVYYKDSEGKYIGCNRAFEEFTGISRQRILGKSAFDIAPRHLAEGYHATDLDLLQKRGVQVYETKVLDSDDTQHNVIFFKTSFPAADGAPAGIIGAMLDITERKQAQEAHEKISRQLQLILDAAGEGILGLDLQGRVTLVNPAAAALCGWKAEELLGKHQHTFIHHSSEDGTPYSADDCPTYATLRDGESHQGLDFFWRKDGTGFPIEFISTPLREEGKVVGAVVIFKDITERNLVEEQLLKLSQAVMQSPVSIMITDTYGNIEFVNPKFTEISGYEPSEIIGRNPRLLKSGRTSGEVYKQLWSTISSGQVWSGEIHNRHKSGETHWERATISPITNSAGVICHYMAFKENMTERKRLEEQLRHAQKMEAIGQLAGGVAHDFNNILTVVLGFGQLLQSSLAKDDPKRGHMDQILDAADRATHLTNSLLAFSRKQVMLLQQVELNELARRLTKFLVRIIGEDISLKTEFSDEPLPVLADNGQIEQVLMNLATNARDAMPAGGELHIKIAPVQLGREFHQQHGYGDPGSYALLTVCDTGAGMDAETQQKIFEPFFTTKAPGRGTGLGLSIVYGIVKQHGGYITVASQPTFGTTFNIYLPLKSQQPQVRTNVTMLAPRGGSETVLVVEDDPAVRRLVDSLLKRYGYTVILAENGDAAIDIFQSKWQDIDLALLDVIMPKMNGRELCELLRKTSPRLKVLFLSGYTSDLIADKGIAVDGIDIIMKPAKPLELARKVRELLDAAPPV
jgi:two-component system, cell cycle sensor histidine kinase and response regulator CckA